MPRPATTPPLFASLMLAAVAAAAAATDSDFDAGNEDWTIVELPAPPYGTVVAEYPAIHRPGDGNPGGAIEATDFNGDLFTFSAPAAFLGDRESDYGTELRFDMQFLDTNIPPGAVHPDVILHGGGLVLVVDGWIDPPEQTGLWEPYAVRLDTSAGWRIGELAGPAATEPQIRAVLASLERVLIRGDYWAGVETTRLDNVRLGGSITPNPDIDGDGDVDFDDLLGVLSGWGPCPPAPAPCPGDVDGNGTVDFDDILAVLAGWTG